MVKINEKVRKWRRDKKKLTLSQAGQLLNLSTSYLCEIETGKKGFTTAVIKEYLNADPNFFKAKDFYPQQDHPQ